MSGQGPSVALDTQESDQLSDRVERLFLQHPCADFVGKELVSRRDGRALLFLSTGPPSPAERHKRRSRRRFSLSQAGFGGLSSSFYYPYILLQVPAGLLVLRFGARLLLIGGISLCTLSCFLTAYSRDLFWVEVARILMGLGSAPTFVCTATLATRWFPPTMLSILIALIETLGMLGPALGQEVLGWIVQTSGWRAGMLACGWFGLLLFVLTFLFVRNSPAPETSRVDGRPRPSGRELARILLSVRLVLVGLVAGMIYSAGLAFAMLWGVSFFELHMSLVQASFCASFFSWGIVIGLPLFGWPCGRVAGPLPLLALGALVTGLSVAVILYGPATYLVFALGMFFCGIANGSYALAFVVVGSSVPRQMHRCRLWVGEHGYPGGRWPVVSAIDWDPCPNARARCARCRRS